MATSWRLLRARDGLVERLIDTRNNRYVFYVAGLSETARAAQFLALEWRQLASKFGDRTPFLVMLRAERDR